MCVCSPSSYLSCLGWATTWTSCQNWEPQDRGSSGAFGRGVPESLLGSMSQNNSPCLPHLCLFSPQGLTGPIGPPGPAGANGEKVSPGSLPSSSLLLFCQGLLFLLLTHQLPPCCPPGAGKMKGCGSQKQSHLALWPVEWRGTGWGWGWGGVHSVRALKTHRCGG